MQQTKNLKPQKHIIDFPFTDSWVLMLKIKKKTYPSLKMMKMKVYKNAGNLLIKTEDNQRLLIVSCLHSTVFICFLVGCLLISLLIFYDLCSILPSSRKYQTLVKASLFKPIWMNHGKLHITGMLMRKLELQMRVRPLLKLVDNKRDV